MYDPDCGKTFQATEGKNTIVFFTKIEEPLFKSTMPAKPPTVSNDKQFSVAHLSSWINTAISDL